MKLFNALFMIIAGVFVAGIIAEIYTNFNIAAYVPGITTAEAALWVLIPLGIMIIFFVAGIAALANRRKDDK